MPIYNIISVNRQDSRYCLSYITKYSFAIIIANKVYKRNRTKNGDQPGPGQGLINLAAAMSLGTLGFPFRVLLVSLIFLTFFGGYIANTEEGSKYSAEFTFPL